jgi:hypothetical protein
MTVTDFNAGPVGDTALLTITGGPNGTARGEILVRPSTGTMTINVEIEFYSLDPSDPLYLNETY